jgi:hypothetical protein
MVPGAGFEPPTFGLHQAFLTGEALTEIARTTVANISAMAGQGSFVEGSLVTQTATSVVAMGFPGIAFRRGAWRIFSGRFFG